MTTRLCVLELRASKRPIRAMSKRPPGKVGMGRIEIQAKSINMPPACTQGCAQIKRTHASSPTSSIASKLRKTGGSVTNGIELEAKYAGVFSKPAKNRPAPANPNTTGTVSAENPSADRSGQGRASIRGRVGMRRTPKGQKSHDEGNKPKAYSAMVKSGTGRMWPLRTP